MPTIDTNNRQDPTLYTIAADGAEHDLLVSTDVDPQGMSVNGGSILHFELDASLSAGDIALAGYRRMRNGAWGLFYSATAVAGSIFTDDIPGVSGWADVRITGLSDVGGTLTVTTAGSITYG